jgi:hypothetical protein
MATTSDKDRVIIFDTTLRDGEQSPGASMTLEEKLEVADLLDAMGVDIIEAGFPIASNGDFEAVAEIAKRIKRATVAGLARAINADIDRAGEAVKFAQKPRIHTFVSTSPIHLEFQMKKSEAEVLDIITATVTRARNLVADVEWSAMDATRTSIEYLCRTVDAAIKAGATTICRIRWAMRRRMNIATCSNKCANALPIPIRRFSLRIAMMIWDWQRRIHSPLWKAARARSNAPSMVLASVQAMPLWKKS